MSNCVVMEIQMFSSIISMYRLSYETCSPAVMQTSDVTDYNDAMHFPYETLMAK